MGFCLCPLLQPAQPDPSTSNTWQCGWPHHISCTPVDHWVVIRWICNIFSSRLEHLSSSELPWSTASANSACKSLYICRCSSSNFSVSLRSSSSCISPQAAVALFCFCKRSFSSRRRFASAYSVSCRRAFSASKCSFSCLKSSTCNLRFRLDMFAHVHTRSRVSTHSPSSLSWDVSPWQSVNSSPKECFQRIPPFGFFSLSSSQAVAGNPGQAPKCKRPWPRSPWHILVHCYRYGKTSYSLEKQQ